MEEGILRGVFEEELDRCKRMKRVFQEELEKLPKGSIVIKTIKGRQYHYLQFREGNKVKSKYISEWNLKEVQKCLERRKELEMAIKRTSSNQKSLEKVLR